MKWTRVKSANDKRMRTTLWQTVRLVDWILNKSCDWHLRLNPISHHLVVDWMDGCGAERAFDHLRHTLIDYYVLNKLSFFILWSCGPHLSLPQCKGCCGVWSRINGHFQMWHFALDVCVCFWIWSTQRLLKYFSSHFPPCSHSNSFCFCLSKRNTIQLTLVLGWCMPPEPIPRTEPLFPSIQIVICNRKPTFHPHSIVFWMLVYQCLYVSCPPSCLTLCVRLRITASYSTHRRRLLIKVDSDTRSNWVHNSPGSLNYGFRC